MEAEPDWRLIMSSSKRFFRPAERFVAGSPSFHLGAADVFGGEGCEDDGFPDGCGIRQIVHGVADERLGLIVPNHEDLFCIR
jgi:hypothetical protein